MTDSIHEQPPNGLYRCNHCSKSFSSTQALGGHQNAHRTQKRRQKKPLKKASNSATKINPDKYNPIKPSNGPKFRPINLDGPFHEPIKLIGPNSSVGSYVPFGSSCKCSQKVATSSPIHVARFRFSKASDTGIAIDAYSPQVKLIGEEDENDNNQGLDLSLKL